MIDFFLYARDAAWVPAADNIHQPLRPVQLLLLYYLAVLNDIYRDIRV